jgi:hypothetical protein
MAPCCHWHIGVTNQAIPRTRTSIATFDYWTIHLSLVRLLVPLFSELLLSHRVDSEEARVSTHAAFSLYWSPETHMIYRTWSAEDA